jgi:hypothetical protein
MPLYSAGRVSLKGHGSRLSNSGFLSEVGGIVSRSFPSPSPSQAAFRFLRRQGRIVNRVELLPFALLWLAATSTLESPNPAAVEEDRTSTDDRDLSQDQGFSSAVGFPIATLLIDCKLGILQYAPSAFMETVAVYSCMLLAAECQRKPDERLFGRPDRVQEFTY